MRSILNYTTSIWFIQVSSTHLDKFEMIKNKALRIPTSCHDRSPSLETHLKLCSQQFPPCHL